MIRTAWLKSLLVFEVLISVGMCQAAATLDYLPHDVLGFVLVRDAQTTNDKLVKLVAIFNEAIPQPLMMAQAISGLTEGLNLHGDAVFAILPAGVDGALPAPMFLVPVADYQALAKDIKADETGEICRVTIADEDVLMARLDEFALMMNVEHRDIMQKLLTREPVIPASISAYQDWTRGNEVSMVVTSAGIAYAAEVAEREANLINVPPDASQQLPAAVDTSLGLAEYLPVAAFFHRTVKAAGLGLAVDDSINSRIRWTVEFQETVNPKLSRHLGKKPLTGFADKPYVIAGGGSLPEEFGEKVPQLLTDLARETAIHTGRAEFTNEDWADVRRSYDLALSRIQAASFLVTPGKEGEPLLSVVFAKLTVDNSQAFLSDMQECFKLSNSIAERTNSDITPNYEITEATVAGAHGIKVTSDLGKATGDGNNHIWQTVLTAVLGDDHELSIYLCPTSNEHVFVALESSDKLAGFIEADRRGDTGFRENATVKPTLAIMDTDTAWLNLFNPGGLVEFVRVGMKSLMILGGFPEFPEYPPAPPLGISLNDDDNAWNGEIVMPVDSARAMAAFTKDVEKMFGR